MYAKYYPFQIMKKYRNASNYLQISQKRSFWAKNGPFLGQKWAIFGQKLSREDPKLVLSLSTLKVDEVRQVSSILDNKKYRNASNYLKISQKRSFQGKNGPFLAQKCVGSDRTVFFLCQPLKLLKYANFHPFWLVKKYRNVLNYHKISQKCSFWGKNRPQIKNSSNFRSTDFCHHLVLA